MVAKNNPAAAMLLPAIPRVVGTISRPLFKFIDPLVSTTNIQTDRSTGGRDSRAAKPTTPDNITFYYYYYVIHFYSTECSKGGRGVSLDSSRSSRCSSCRVVCMCGISSFARKGGKGSKEKKKKEEDISLSQTAAWLLLPLPDSLPLPLFLLPSSLDENET